MGDWRIIFFIFIAASVFYFLSHGFIGFQIFAFGFAIALLVYSLVSLIE